MQYLKSEKYPKGLICEKIMGPNPVKLVEELMTCVTIPQGGLVMDLGSGSGITSVFLAKEYGFRVIAADLWSNPTDVWEFFQEMELDAAQILPIHADANDLPFAHEFFDAVISADSYHYFGRDSKFLNEKLLPFVKKGGLICLCVPGMKKDCHENLPDALLASWTPEQLDYIHDVAYWRSLIEQADGVEILSIHEMESNEEVWADWLACENEYAIGDRAAFEAGAGELMNFVAIVVKKKGGITLTFPISYNHLSPTL